MDRTEQMASEIAIRLNGGEWKDGKWYGEGHRKAWIYAVQLHAEKIEYLMKCHDDLTDEIERLRSALIDIVELENTSTDFFKAVEIARAATENREPQL